MTLQMLIESIYSHYSLINAKHIAMNQILEI